jgi:hypothetical protein
LKKIIRFQKRRPQWDLEKLYTQKQSVHDTLERNPVQLNVTVGMLK